MVKSSMCNIICAIITSILKNLGIFNSRDITILIVLLWFSIVHYSYLFQYFFYLSTIVPALVENS